MKMSRKISKARIAAYLAISLTSLPIANVFSNPHPDRFYLVFDDLVELRFSLSNLSNLPPDVPGNYESELIYIKRFIATHVTDRRENSPSFFCLDKATGVAYYQMAKGGGSTSTFVVEPSPNFQKCYQFLVSIMKESARISLALSVINKSNVENALKFVNLTTDPNMPRFSDDGQAQILTAFSRRVDDDQTAFAVAARSDPELRDIFTTLRTERTFVRSGRITDIDLEKRTFKLVGWDGPTYEVDFPSQPYATVLGESSEGKGILEIKEPDFGKVLRKAEIKGVDVKVRMNDFTGLRNSSAVKLFVNAQLAPDHE